MSNSNSTPDTVDAVLNNLGEMIFGPKLAEIRTKLDEYEKDLDSQIAGFQSFMEGQEGKQWMSAELKKHMEPLKAALLKRPPLVIRKPNGKLKSVGRQHPMFEELAKAVGSRLHVYLTGPSGTGKTTAARLIAQALDLPFGAISCNPHLPESRILGFVDANGNPRDVGNLKRAYQNGWVFLFDEIDSSNPQVMTAINMLIESPTYLFPGDTEPTERHEDFIVLAAANTWGYGATVEYVGRNQLDEATRQRFIFLDWGYDNDWEADMYGSHMHWVELVQQLRRTCEGKGVRLVLSQRNMIQAIRMEEAGMNYNLIMQGAIWKGLEQTQIESLMSCPDLTRVATACRNKVCGTSTKKKK